MFISFLRTLILYPLLLLVVRLMGKRQLGQMEPAEFVAVSYTHLTLPTT